MNIKKYIKLIKSSQRYQDIRLGKKQVDLSALCGENDYSKVKYRCSCCDDKIEIEPGIYARENKLKCYSKFDDDGYLISYSKVTDPHWKHYLFINSYIICSLNRTVEFDENLWFYIYCEISKKFKYCIDNKDWLDWSVNLAAGCEKIFHEEISDNDWSQAIWKHWQQYRRPPKTKRSLKLTFDKELYDDYRLVGCKDGLCRSRKLESLTMKEWFKEIFPTCNTKEEVISKMCDKIHGEFTESSYKRYKAELFPDTRKEHKEHDKSEQQRLKEQQNNREFAFKCFELQQTYGNKWKSKLTKAQQMYGRRHKEDIVEYLNKAEDIIKVAEYVNNYRKSFVNWQSKADESFVNAWLQMKDDVEWYIEQNLNKLNKR